MIIKYSPIWNGYQAQQLHKGELVTAIAQTPAKAIEIALKAIYKTKLT